MSSAPARLLPYLGSAATIALSALVLLVIDASSRFSVLPETVVAFIGLVCVAWLALLVFRSASGSGPGRAGLAVMLCLAAVTGLTVNRLARMIRIAALPSAADAPAMEDLDRRASSIQAEFGAVVSRASTPLDAARGRMASFAGGPAVAFDLVEAIDRQTAFTRQGGGLSLYDAAGAPLAWAGSSYPATPGMLDGLSEGVIEFRAVSEGHLARLYGLLSIEGRVLVTETTILSRLDPRIRDRELPALTGDDAVILKLQDFRKPETGFADLLARRKDRYPGGAAGERGLLFVGLRAPDHTFLGYARLRGTGQSDLRRHLDSRHRDAAGLIVAVFLAGLCLITFYPRRPAGRTPGAAKILPDVAAGLTVIWGGRIVLSWFPVEQTSWLFPLFDSTMFASVWFFHLLRSPGDLLMTTLAIFGSALIVTRAGGRAAAAGGSRALGAAGNAMLVCLVVVVFLIVPMLARELVGNSAINLMAVDLLSPAPVTLAMQTSALLFLCSIFLFIEAAIHLAGAGGGVMNRLARLLPRPGDGLSRWILGAFLPGILIASFLYVPLLVPPSRKANETLFEDQLLPMVIRQSENRRSMVRAAVDALAAMPDLPDKIREAGSSPSSMALDLWLRTPLKDAGYNASLLVTDPEGRTISRFAQNLPPAFDRRAPETYVPPGEPTLERVSFLNLIKRIWHADHYVVSDDRLLGTVTVHMLDDFDNIPFRIAERPYARALSPQLRRITTLPSGSRGVRYAVYEQHGRPVFWTQREAPALPPDWTSLLVSPGTLQWSDLSEEERPARYLFFSDGEHVFALGFIQAAWLERIARSIRLCILGLMLLAALLLPAALVQAQGRMGRWWPQLVEAMGRTHYRKLLSTFAAATFIPLFLLSLLMTGYITREVDNDIEDRGRQGIQSASSLVRTILETEESANPDDDTLYWLSLLVGEDVNLYEHGELVATSRPELFSSGLLSRRIDGRVYRRLTLDGGRFAMGKGTLKAVEYRTITATVVANEGNWEGLLSLPLDAQTAEAVIAAREVADAMLITFLGMMVLMGGVAYLLARRVSRPIRSLREAAARIAAGDLDAEVGDRPRDETGELIASFNRMARAIKEQREDLERRKDYIEKILLNATIGVISLDTEGRIVTANPAARSILGLPQLVEGVRLLELVSSHAPLGPLAAPLRDPVASSSRDVELSIPAEPSDRTVRARLVPFLEGQGLILLLEDVTETVRSNRLAAWAEMARRIAHEIKNPLTPIQLSTEHIRRVYEEGSPAFPAVLEECLRTIMGAVANLRQISAEFSTYARIPVTRKEPADMAQLIEEVARPYLTATPPGIEIAIDMAPELPRLSVDRSLIGRALVNLIENALQAMPRGGTLTVHARSDEERLIIEVSDTGIGMNTESLARIFEPYFSTKDTGTGLGMAIARKAIEEHGGRIEVMSAQGRGTTMRIVLPISPETSSSALTAEKAGGRRLE